MGLTSGPGVSVHETGHGSRKASDTPSISCLRSYSSSGQPPAGPAITQPSPVSRGQKSGGGQFGLGYRKGG